MNSDENQESKKYIGGPAGFTMVIIFVTTIVWATFSVDTPVRYICGGLATAIALWLFSLARELEEMLDVSMDITRETLEWIAEHKKERNDEAAINAAETHGEN